MDFDGVRRRQRTAPIISSPGRNGGFSVDIVIDFPRRQAAVNRQVSCFATDHIIWLIFCGPFSWRPEQPWPSNRKYASFHLHMPPRPGLYVITPARGEWKVIVVKPPVA